jgi:hypothetical protein
MVATMAARFCVLIFVLHNFADYGGCVSYGDGPVGERNPVNDGAVIS